MTFIDEKGKEINWLCVLYRNRDELLGFMESRGIKCRVVAWGKHYEAARRIVQVASSDTDKVSLAINEMGHIANERYLATHDEFGRRTCK